MSNPEFNLVFSFACPHAMGEYLQQYEEFVVWRENKLQRKLNDRRGHHIKDLHRRAKEFHDAHPMLPYRECLKIVSKKD